MRITCIALIALCTLLAPACAMGLSLPPSACAYDYFNTNWTCINTETGLDEWMCQAAKQSPIDLPPTFVDAAAYFSAFARGSVDVNFERNLTVANVSFPATGGVSFDSATPSSDVPDADEFLGFYIRTPSEHSIGGQQFSIEFQFVYYNSNDTKVTIVAILAQLADNDGLSPGIQKLYNALSGSIVDNARLSVDLSGFDDGASFWRYSGSFTSPPCEPADWLVSTTPQRINQETLTAFQSFISLNNTLGENVATPARPTQPIDGRVATLLSPSTPRSNSGNWKVAVGISAAILGVIFIVLILGAVVFSS